VKTWARVSTATGWLVLSVALCASPSFGASFADLAQDGKELALLSDRLLIRVPQGARLEPLTPGLMEAPSAQDQQNRMVIDSGPLRMVAIVTELFRVSPAGLAQLGTAFAKSLQENRPVGELLVAPQATNVNGLEVFDYEPRGPAKFGDANFVKGALTRHPDGTVQLIHFFVNDAGLADLPAVRQLIRDMVASLKPGSRQLPSGTRVQVGAGDLTLREIFG
jgi:hypothetical protein